MKKKIFAICDLEESYVVRLADYLNRSAQLPMQVVAFTKPEALRKYAEEHPVEVLLISSEAMSEDVKEMNVRRVIILTDGEDPELEKKGEYIQKYQNSDSIARQVMQYAGEQRAASLPEGCGIFGVYSPVGRCGKTMFSLALASILSENEKTLYINLENYSGFESLFRTTYQTDITDLMYAARQNADRFPGLLDSELRMFGNMCVVPPAFFPEDLKDIKKEEWEGFFFALAGGTECGNIVLDIGTYPGDVTDILGICTHIYMPVLSDPVSRAKISHFEKNLDALSSDRLKSSITRVYVPDVTVRNSGGALLDDLTYGKMGQFVRGLLEGERQQAA